MKKAILLVNFGGPRSLSEIESFLISLLTDRALIRTKLPSFLHNFLFRRVAKKRTKNILPDYEWIGGKSPIFETTEQIASLLRNRIQQPLFTFHRYLSSTHKESLATLEAYPGEILVFPFFPQFSYATTGSIAALFEKQLSSSALQKLHWIQSYPTHPAFIEAWTQVLSSFFNHHQIEEEQTILLFSVHGLPISFIRAGDPYERECRESVTALLLRFPRILGRIAYQSKFGTEEWLSPSTEDVCKNILEWNQGRRTVVFAPIAFTSDHIETLFEIERLYLPLIQKQGLRALRCPALNCESIWIDAIESILQSALRSCFSSH